VKVIETRSRPYLCKVPSAFRSGCEFSLVVVPVIRLSDGGFELSKSIASIEGNRSSHLGNRLRIAPIKPLGLSKADAGV
jgi:hypothetical protein